MKVFESRKYVFLGIIVIVSLSFVARLFYLQVIDKDYQQFAKQNILQKRILYPPRGLIYDRNGELLVSNQTVYDLMVTPSKIKSFDTSALCNLLDLERETFEQKLQEARNYSYYKPSVFLKQVSVETFGNLQERLWEFRGFFPRPRTTRKYPNSIGAHMIGYLGEVSQEDISQSDYYMMGDLKGISGLEKEYNRALRGQKGIRNVLVDVMNRNKGSYLGGDLDQPSQPGKNLITTLDAELQAYGEKLMKDKVGSVVAIEPETGEILAMVSSPTYDPNLLVGRKRANNYPELVQDPLKPLFNRAVTASYPLGSTIKPLQALIALDEGVVTLNETYTCRNGYHTQGISIRCHQHENPVDLPYSIETSCNAYYCNVFRKVVDQDTFESTAAGYSNWKKHVEKFGLGKELGIDLPTEKVGSLPTTNYYNEIYGKGRWKSPTVLSLAIGQGEIGATCLQMANYTASIANKGYYVTPHLVSSIRSDTTNYLQYSKQQTGIDSSHFNPIIEAMYQVVESGTGRYYGKVEDLKISGKTGTAQNPHGEDHSLFIAFAPKDDPEIAVAAIIENAGYGSTWAAPTNTLMIEKYLTDTIGSSKRKWIEQRVLDTSFIAKKDSTVINIDTTSTE